MLACILVPSSIPGQIGTVDARLDLEGKKIPVAGRIEPGPQDSDGTKKDEKTET
jgi:hypothetical protein